MKEIYLDASEMVKWQTYLGELPRITRPALARGLNFYGNETVKSWSEAIADETGLEAGAVINLIRVDEATPDTLEFSADASSVVSANAQWLRPWAERDKANFEQDTLVKIITVGDRFDCEICAEAAENSPYTMREITQMSVKWAHWHGSEDIGPAAGTVSERTHLLHPRCRCTYQPWTSTRRMPLSFGGKGKMPKELLSARKLGQRVVSELKIVLKVKT